MRTSPPRRRAAAALLSVGVAGSVLAGCGGSHTSEPVYAMTPAWTVTAPTGGPSAAAFCRLLGSDYHHLHTASTATRQEVEANFTGFIDAAPTVEKAAPASIAGDARVYLSITTDFFETLLENKIQHKPGPRSLGIALRTKGAVAAMKTFETFVAANCHPDPLG